MKEQFIYSPIRAEMERHADALKLVEGEGSVLVGTEFVGWSAANCQRHLSIVVLSDNNSAGSLAEGTESQFASRTARCVRES